MELTDKNATGNFSSFSFTKDVMQVNLTPMNMPSFSGITITWEPVITTIEDNYKAKNIIVYPNPTKGISFIRGKSILQIQIRSASGELVHHTNFSKVDISNQPDGIYFLLVETTEGTFSRKILKNSHNK
jgi:hypothetical protein